MKEINEVFGDEMTWDIKNTAGKDITGGLYIYSLTAPDGTKKTGKIVIN